MIFIETKLSGAYIIDPKRYEDERGFFARSWCQAVFAENGLHSQLAQCNISFNTKKGTLRGMHYQERPHAEAKLVRCTQGAIYDVVVDLRPNSSTFKQWIGVALTSENHRMVYVPEEFAHGFLTLEDGTEVFYQMSGIYEPRAARGIRWDDPQFNIYWPEPVLVISGKDRAWEDFDEQKFISSKSD